MIKIKENKLFKRNDIILIALVVVVSIVLFIAMIIRQEDGGMVVVKVSGETWREFSLHEERTINLDFDDGSYNTLVIQDGFVRMSEASCPDQICVNHKEIQKSGETIVCLPNQVVIEIESDSQSEIDAIVK